MKRLLILITFISTLQLSCEKIVSDSAVTSLVGKWKMILVKDNVTNETIIKPASISGNVIIVIVVNNATSGIFTGNTPTNEIFENNFTVQQDGECLFPLCR